MEMSYNNSLGSHHSFLPSHNSTISKSKTADTWDPIKYNNSSSSSRNNSALKISFPFCDIKTFDKCLDRNAILQTNLRILKQQRALELAIQGTDIGSVSVKGKKKDATNTTSAQSKTSTFPIQALFNNINSEACLHTLYLLFDCYDSKETEIRFRDIWPTYEKKLEASFRRVAANWLKDIVKENPTFFPGIKEVAIGGLLVNFAGDRFIYLIDCFTDFVMSEILKRSASQNGTVVKPVYEKPVYTADSEITNRQILGLVKVTHGMAHETRKCRKQMIANEIELQSRIKLMESRKQKILEEKKTEIPEHVNSMISSSKLSPPPSSLENLSLYKYLGNLVPKQLPKIINATAESVNELQNKALEAVELSKSLEGDFNQLRRLWYILNMDQLQENTLDGGKLFILPSSMDDTQPNFEDFTNTISRLTNELLMDENLNKPLCDNLLQDFKKANLNFRCNNLILQDLIKRYEMIRCNPDLSVQLRLMQIRLRGIDWSRVSKVTDSSLMNTFTSHPSTLTLELSTQSGLTPKLLNFLDDKISKNGRTRKSVRNRIDFNRISDLNVSNSTATTFPNAITSPHTHSDELSIQNEITPPESLNSLDTNNTVKNGDANLNNSDLNRSLLEDWIDEEMGIMDMSYSTVGYDSSDEAT